ncbi:MAG: putative hydroxymethylpyrimidine transport system permease protein [Solirubrobacteraceae bacterium]|jgi:ABC-type nitrate/sulfonate/bicarbonate transport system permease component|nr:putative hydroxymethylpyrimidine transport system permease protein [Solirubrobacteraceae bacterium]
MSSGSTARRAYAGPLRGRGPGALPALVLAALLLGAWELYVRLGPIDPLILPAPSAIAGSLVSDRSLLWSNFTVTAGEVLPGMALALILAAALAAAIHFCPLLRRAAYPLLVASQAVPLVLLTPLLVAWLGFGLLPKLAIIVLVSFFPILVATLDGLAAVEPDLLKLMSTLGASRWQTFVRVEAPSALPALFSGARVGVVFSLIGAFFAEYAGGASDGLGLLVEQAIPQLETARAAAAVTLLAALAVALFAALTAAERRLAPWGAGT